MGAGTLIGARLLQYAGGLVLFGTPLFFLYATRPGAEALTRWSWERRLLLAAAATALIGALVWVMAETAVMSGDSADAINPAALWTVLSETRFGLACLFRIALLALSVSVCLAVSRRKMFWWAQVLLGGAISLSFAWTGHGAAQIGRTAGIHLVGDLLHLLAAGSWIGALVSLSTLGVRARRSGAIEDAAVLGLGLRAFSAIGVWIVAVLIFSGIINSIFLLDFVHWREAVNSQYGRVLFMKLALFGAMLCLAALNRYRTGPKLHDALQRRTSLAAAVQAARSILSIETLMAALVLLAVSVLGTLAPLDVQTDNLGTQHEPPPLT
ncbi:MAG: copper homeostasis membrane protein CopD [Pseudomonadota bacterium]|nr:copper homeostasis membrane protein CopD [Pseudomonadota bacterium]